MNVKKNKLNEQNKILARASLFLVHLFLAVPMQDYDVNFSNPTFYVRGVEISLWFFFIKILGELKWSRGLQREQTILRVMNGPCLAGTVSLKFAPPTKTERLLAKPSSLSVGNEIHALHGKHHEVCPRPNPHLNVSNRPFALRCPVTSLLWKWKLCDFAFKKRLVGHILNKIIVIWFFKPAPFS